MKQSSVSVVAMVLGAIAAVLGIGLIIANLSRGQPVAPGVVALVLGLIVLGVASKTRIR